MADLVSKVENDIRRLRTALSSGNEEQVDRYLPSLQRSLLDDQSYLSIWDERLLAEASCLISRCCDEELRDERLKGLSQHLLAVRSVHDKLYAILDPGIELDVLLFLHLYEWSQLLDEPIECRFDNAAKNKLHEARGSDNTEHGLENFLTAYFQHLRDQDLNDVVDVLEPFVESAFEGYKRAHCWTVHGLFVTPQNEGEVRGLKIRPEANGTGQIKYLNRIGPEMETAANRALACVGKLWSHARLLDFTWEIEGGEITFTGDSIGLALTIGILAEIEPFDIDAYTAFTGHVNWATGEVGRVEYLGAKLEAAKALGIRRVFIPRDNVDDVDGVDGIEIIQVGSIEEARQWLRSRSYEHAITPLEWLANAGIRELEFELKAQDIQKVEHDQRKEYCKRVVFSDYRDKVFVDVYYKKDLKPIVQVKHTDLSQTVQGACDRVFGAKPYRDKTTKAERLYSKYVVVSPTDQKRIEDYIFGRDNSIRESEQNCIYRAKIVRAHQTVFVRQYSSGTLTVDGFAPLFEDVDRDIKAILGVPEADSDENDEHQAHLNAQVEAVEAVQLGEQWIGTDESGKGDYYGPLVGAAVLVDERIAELLAELGVKDSKRLSDKRVHELAAQILQVCGKRARVVTISPERYNALYEEFRNEGKNLNTLVAWAHARALEDILSEFPQERITVLVDRFADESYIQSKLLEKGRRTDLNLVQLPRAEVNIAVAAASVLARAQFLQWLERLSRQYRVDLPKGASDPRIVQVGKQIVTRYGQDGLAKVTKLHFKTTKRILASD